MESMWLEGDGAEVERTILSYDASGGARSKAARACQIVFGYEQHIARNGTTHTYHRLGYMDRPGARWIGQSVLLLRHEDAAALASELSRLGIRVRTARIRIRRTDLGVFTVGPGAR